MDSNLPNASSIFETVGYSIPSVLNFCFRSVAPVTCAYDNTISPKMKYTFCTNYFRGFPANRPFITQDSPPLLSCAFDIFLFFREKPHYFAIFRTFFCVSILAPLRFPFLFTIF